jgi:hypothetical protein
MKENLSEVMLIGLLVFVANLIFSIFKVSKSVDTFNTFSITWRIFSFIVLSPHFWNVNRMRKKFIQIRTIPRMFIKYVENSSLKLSFLHLFPIFVSSKIQQNQEVPMCGAQKLFVEKWSSNFVFNDFNLRWTGEKHKHKNNLKVLKMAACISKQLCFSYFTFSLCIFSALL